MKTTNKTSVEFSAMGRATPHWDSWSDILVGANLGCAQLVGLIERNVQWEKQGSSRRETAVAGSARFSVQPYCDELEVLAGQEFKSFKDAKDAVRAALEVK